MISQTACEGCIFKENALCNLGKKTHVENEIQCINGFCRHKRGYKWLSKQFPTNIVPSSNEIKKVIDHEEQRISAIILLKSTDEIENVINHLLKNKIVKQIILACKQTTQEEILKIATFLSQCKIEWTIDNVVDENLVEDKDAIGYASRLLKNNWFVTIQNDELFDPQLFNLASKQFSKNNNIMCIKHDKCPFVLINRFCFYDLSGNNDGLFIDKIKKFENYNNICKIIS
jgi:hypothetical protein